MAVKTEKLVRMAQRGDREAFVCLMEAHKLSMSRTALAVLHNEEDAADAIGDTVLTAFTKLCTLREPKYFKTWLTRVLLCNCYSILRLRRGLGTVKAVPEAEYNDTEFGEGQWPAYRDENGFYASFPAEKDPDGQAEYSQLLFCLYYPEDCIGATQFRERDLKNECMVDRIEVVNTETGQVLLDDLEIGQAYSPEQ
ncbi:MAG TPA: hypothetical protein H9838_05505 [Candidatus Acutalibacter pullistercoris]|uniref:Uncharacterized protein n=1 Tax=Candidatus Acutalibacter pullistercoris TaxID=2838418 RepID=A0A9D2C0T8_9FIRM|nr:hypothetical protein [Candidatus Acutalibacter pullistercoris]